MNDKLTLQELIDLLAARHQMEPQDADAFVKAFWALIEEGLKRDNYVKIKGLGTFKLIETEARESIDVHSGERIEIQSHARITFSPDANLRDQINRPFAHFETVILNEGIQFDSVDDKSDDLEEESEENVSKDAEMEKIEAQKDKRSSVHDECASDGLRVQEELVSNNDMSKSAADEFVAPEEEMPAMESLKASPRSSNLVIEEEQPIEVEEAPVQVAQESASQQHDEAVVEVDTTKNNEEKCVEEVPAIEESKSLSSEEVVVEEQPTDSSSQMTEDSYQSASIIEVKSDVTAPIADNQSFNSENQVTVGVAAQAPLENEVSATNQTEQTVLDHSVIDENLQPTVQGGQGSMSDTVVDGSREQDEPVVVYPQETEKVVLAEQSDLAESHPDKETVSLHQKESESHVTKDEVKEPWFDESLSPKKPRFPWCMVATVLFVGILIGGIVAWGLMSGRRYIPEEMVGSLLNEEEQNSVSEKNTDFNVEDNSQSSQLTVPKSQETGENEETQPSEVSSLKHSDNKKVDITLPALADTKKTSGSVNQSEVTSERPKVLSDKIEYNITGTLSTHKIRRGDSLVKLALKFYGNKKLWPYIVKYNRNTIKNPDNVPIGTQIQIPKLSPKATA